MISEQPEITLEESNQIINDIFEKVLEENSHFMRKINRYLEHTIQHRDKQALGYKFFVYRNTLVQENNFLYRVNNNNDHPLRVAHALSALNNPEKDDCFLKNIETFHNEATNSTFYPKAILIGVFISSLLLSIGLSLIVIGVTAIFMSILIPISIIIIDIISSIVTSLYLVYLVKKEIQPVLDSENAGSAISKFFTKNEEILKPNTQVSDNILHDESTVVFGS